MAQKNFADAMNQIVNGTNGLKKQIDTKADKYSPALTGTPTAPTADNDTDSAQIATTEFCQNLIRRLCGVDTKTIALLADLADALLNQPDFRDAVVTVLGNKLDKTDAATTYATKAELNNVSIDTSNLAKLTDDNDFTAKNNFDGKTIFEGEVELNGNVEIDQTLNITAYSTFNQTKINMYNPNGDGGLTIMSQPKWSTTAGSNPGYAELRYTSSAGYAYINFNSDEAEICVGSTRYYFKSDGIYKGSTKIA